MPPFTGGTSVACHDAEMARLSLKVLTFFGGTQTYSIASRAAITSIPSHKFCNRMFSFAECWLLS